MALKRNFGAADAALSDAQNALPVDADTKIESPRDYKLADEIYGEIEKLRRKLMNRRR